jgi:hypothetical protein
MAHPVLHIVAKNPEIEHIADDVQPAAMKKHEAEQRRYHVAHRLGIEKTGRYNAVPVDER